MNENNENSDKVSKENRNDEESASHFALQIALQTMKERCQLLQQRLSAVEDENLRLRIENQNYTRKSREGVPASEINKLEEKVTQLSRQKCQLIDRITMVAKENNQLWTRLSRVTEANQSLGDHLSKISDTLNKHPISDTANLNPDETITCDDDDGSKFGSDEKKEESLEEISLKIIDTYRKEKKVLEKQCEEMVELQTVEECGFTLTANGDIASGIIECDNDYENVMEDIKKVREKMADGYKTLRDQQAGLQAAIASLNILITEKKNCKCKGVPLEDASRVNKNLEKNSQVMTTSTIIFPVTNIQKHLKDVTGPPETDSVDVASSEHGISEMYTNNPTEINNDDVNNYIDDRMCPLCGRLYSHEGSFNEFHNHVLSHFSGDGNDDESIINNYEVIT